MCKIPQPRTNSDVLPSYEEIEVFWPLAASSVKILIIKMCIFMAKVFRKTLFFNKISNKIDYLRLLVRLLVQIIVFELKFIKSQELRV